MFIGINPYRKNADFRLFGNKVNLKWVGILFAFATVLSSFGTGSLPQINSISNSMLASFGINKMLTGGVLAILLGAVIIGLVAGFLLVTASNYFENNGVDDAVGAVSVHGICGTWGVLAVAIFDTTDGLVFGGTSLLVPLLIGAISIGTWAYVTSFVAFKIIDA